MCLNINKDFLNKNATIIEDNYKDFQLRGSTEDGADSNGIVCDPLVFATDPMNENSELYVRMCSWPAIGTGLWTCGTEIIENENDIVYKNQMSYKRTGLSFDIGIMV